MLLLLRGGLRSALRARGAMNVCAAERNPTRPDFLSLCHFSSGGDTTTPSGNAGDADSPLGSIIAATDSLKSFSSRLRSLSQTIQENVTLSSGQTVTLRDIVLHSRDASPKDFSSSAAKAARAEVRPLADIVEGEMKSMADDFLKEVAPQVMDAEVVCQNTPCGGATWEIALKGQSNDDVHEKMKGKDTPCGRLEAASREFVLLSDETREVVALGSRAACLLRLAEEHGSPLVEVRKSQEGRELMAKTFAAEKIATPWVRPKEEYEEFRKMQGLHEESGGEGKKE